MPITMKIVLIFIFTVLSSLPSKGQAFGGTKNLIENGRFAWLAAYNYNRIHFGEIGIVRGYRVHYNGHESEMIALETLYPYISLSSEFQLSDELLICPKLGYHFVLSFIDLGLTAFTYTDFRQSKFGVRPEAGLSLAGMLSACYGYNLGTKPGLFAISNHNFSVRVIVGSGLFKKFPKKEGGN